ncbi:hypothetical protein D1614_08540 [Maribellus luteus]|uniref:Lipocalin-like domain-containing protein n=1 Tax=Maribellus luteus TaxID=2305463 RepID=A0A399T0N8_9BACT|nr:hypothetical protein [Maribellus luteus]RIJ48574.1 hypothetical protein D1614_08540 [Maribellus luteus]
MKQLITLLLLFVVLSCSKDDDSPNKQIIGKWEWTETINPWTGIKYTPQSEGYSQISVYKADNTVEYYKNGELTGTESYQIEEIQNPPESSIGAKTTFLIINTTKIPFTIQNDFLVLNQAYVDGPTSIYKRIQ